MRFGVSNSGRVLLAMAVISGALVVSAPPAAAEQLPHPAPMEGRTANTMTADPLPTVQIDSGVVWAVKVVGNTVFAGGNFSNARPAGAAPGTNLVPRSNLLSFSLTTGQLTSFAPTFNGQVKSLAASPDGTRIYVGGSFTSVNGKTRHNVAAFSTATGELLETWKPAVGGAYVNAIAATDTTVYVGGLLGAGNGVVRKNLMAFNASGTLLGWAPTTDLQVDAMVLTPAWDKVIVGGRFATVNGVSQRGLVALHMTDGSILPWIAPNVVKNGWNASPYAGKAGIYSLSTDGSAIYGTGWVYANATVGNLEGAFAAEPGTGAIRWLEDCHGDTYSSYSDGHYIYMPGHQHDCESVGGQPQKDSAPQNMRNSVAFTAAVKGTVWRSPRVNSIYLDWSGQPAPAQVHWFPDWTTGSFTGQGQAGWTVDGAGDYMVVGGEFPFVNGQRSQGIARFARAHVSGAKQGPRLSGANWTPTVSSQNRGTARITIPGNWDRDDLSLTYRITRSGSAQPVHTTTFDSYFWYQPTLTFVDTGLNPGSTYTYRVTATDGDGNQATSAEATVTVTNTVGSAYAQRVLADGAALYWRLGDPGGTTDQVLANNGIARTGVTNASTGAVDGRGYTFSGTNTGTIGSTLNQLSPDGWSAEIWFRTTSNRGGKLIGFGTSQTGNSATYDRHLYMTNEGRLSFGIRQNNVTKVITSPGTYRNGQWHHAMVTSGPSGSALYVDGVLAGADQTMIKGHGYYGYWRVGGDIVGSWPNRGTSDWFAGDLDEFAVYTAPLTQAHANTHYLTGTGASAPTASFTQQISNLNLTVNGSGSTAQAGATISSYSWDFGDGSPAATGVTATHAYSAGGTYPVTLTVTDSRGMIGVSTQQVQVSGPHQPPTVSFTASGSGLRASVDASASQASGGATLSYSWNWGDGTAPGTGVTAQHVYQSPGTKTITLTLTDSLGGTASGNRTVTLTHADPTPAFTTAVDALRLTVDAGGSQASDGATLAYEWNWGDGTAVGTGVTATHTYAAAGQYTVVLRLTDSLGGTAQLSRTVTVVAAADLEVVKADFGQNVASGWGNAVTGGAWTTSGTGFSVTGGVGRLSLAASGTRTAGLNSVSADNVRGTVELALDKVPAGGQAHFNYDLRKGSDGSYRVKLRFLDTGTISVVLSKLVGTAETTLVTRTVTGYTYSAGDQVRVAFEVDGDGSSTTLRANVWGPSQSEPTSWLATATDNQATLQDAGAVGLVGYVQAAVTNGPIVYSVDNLVVRKLV